MCESDYHFNEAIGNYIRIFMSKITALYNFFKLLFSLLILEVYKKSITLNIGFNTLITMLPKISIFHTSFIIFKDKLQK